MRTSEEAHQSGLYASGCCGEELLFGKGDTLWRCPQCQRLCEWELVKIAVFTRDLENLERLRSESAVA
jgi:hypothetical protein